MKLLAGPKTGLYKKRQPNTRFGFTMARPGQSERRRGEAIATGVSRAIAQNLSPNCVASSSS